MSRFVQLSPVLLAWGAFALSHALAQPNPAAENLEVQDVRADRVRGPGGDWWCMEVRLNARAAGARFVRRPGVTVELGFEVSSDSGRRFEFYRAEAVAVTVEQGPVSFRFYVPPEVVERDRVSSLPRFFFVEPTIGGVARPTRRENVSGTLATPDALAKFRARVAAEAPANQGVLRSHGTVDPRLIDGAGLPTLILP